MEEPGARTDTRTPQPFDIDAAVRLIRKAVKPYPKAALFELADEGHGTVFKILVACIISTRTRDETTLPLSRAFFAAAPTPDAVAAMPLKEVVQLLRGSTFYRVKAQQIQAIARRAVEEYGGELPCDMDAVLSLKGVGPKCANLALGIACGRPFIGVDIHVHRITNRWGYVATAKPERTIAALEAKLPKKYWIEINKLLVPFGKHVCTPVSPKCSTCPLSKMCRQVGVTNHR